MAKSASSGCGWISVDEVCRRGETNQQVFYVFSLCFIGFLFLALVQQVFLCMLVVFRCRYIFCYIDFNGCAYYRIVTWSCLGVAT